MQEATGQGLIAFWPWAAKKGLVKEATAGARRSAVSEVLDALGEKPESVDIRKLDVEDALRRFENLKSPKYTPGSLATYKSRFRKAVDDYLAYVDNPSGWRPGIKTRVGATHGSGKPSPRSVGGPSNQADSSASAAHHSPSNLSSGPRLIEYPFPVREGVVALIRLPMDLRLSEAKRLGAWLAALAMPDRGDEEVD